MNRRSSKVHRIGHTSLAVILPKDWTRGMEIDAGDVVEVLYNGDGDLTIRKREGSD